MAHRRATASQFMSKDGAVLNEKLKLLNNELGSMVIDRSKPFDDNRTFAINHYYHDAFPALESFKDTIDEYYSKVLDVIDWLQSNNIQLIDFYYSLDQFAEDVKNTRDRVQGWVDQVLGSASQYRDVVATGGLLNNQASKELWIDIVESDMIEFVKQQGYIPLLEKITPFYDSNISNFFTTVRNMKYEGSIKGFPIVGMEIDQIFLIGHIMESSNHPELYDMLDMFVDSNYRFLDSLYTFIRQSLFLPLNVEIMYDSLQTFVEKVKISIDNSTEPPTKKESVRVFVLAFGNLADYLREDAQHLFILYIMNNYDMSSVMMNIIDHISDNSDLGGNINNNKDKVANGLKTMIEFIGNNTSNHNSAEMSTMKELHRIVSMFTSDTGNVMINAFSYI